MGNGKYRNWGYWLDEEEYIPAFYIPTIHEAIILSQCELLKPEGKIKRQLVLYDGVEVGWIQLGFGYGESYVIKPVNSNIGEKLRCSKDQAVLHLIRITCITVLTDDEFINGSSDIEPKGFF
jgi:hypothetical protein